MRTTFNPSPRVQRALRERAQLQGKSISQVVNELLEQAVEGDSLARAPYKVRAKPLGLRPGIDPERFGYLLEELEASKE